MSKINKLLENFNIKTDNISIYELAFTHPSCNSDRKTEHNDYEKLEFMGDAFLGFTVADLIYKYHPELREGQMTKLRSFLVRTNSLSNYARKYDYANYINVGHSISKDLLFKSDKIFEDVFEAMIGAVYLDKGYQFAYKFIENIFLEDVKKADMNVLTDAKSRLQEEMQSEYRDSVHYEDDGFEGPPHDRTYFVKVLFNDIVLATGSGHSKKAAEENAAENALAKRRI